MRATAAQSATSEHGATTWARTKGTTGSRLPTKMDWTIRRAEDYYLGFPDPILFADGSLGVAHTEHALERLRGHGARLAHGGVGRRNGVLCSIDGGRTGRRLGYWPASRVEQLSNGDLLGYSMRWATAATPAELEAAGLGPVWPGPAIRRGLDLLTGVAGTSGRRPECLRRR